MRRRDRSPALAVLAAAGVLLLPACQLDDDAEPQRDAATVSETLPADAGDLENPEEVVSPGGGSGETSGETPDGAGGDATGDGG